MTESNERDRRPDKRREVSEGQSLQGAADSPSPSRPLDIEAIRERHNIVDKWDQNPTPCHTDRAALLAEVERLRKMREMAGGCKWCGSIHERGDNTLCPFTIAEAEVLRLRFALAQEEWRHEPELARENVNLKARLNRLVGRLEQSADHAMKNVKEAAAQGLADDPVACVATLANAVRLLIAEARE